MKRKLFFALMLCALALVFSLFVSAEKYGDANIYYFDCSVEELSQKDVSQALLFTVRDANDVITSYSGSIPKTNASGEAISWYKLGSTTVGENVFVALQSFVTTDSQYCTITSGVYSFKNGPTKSNVVSVNFPNDSGITAFKGANETGFFSQTGGYLPDNSELLFAYFPNTWRDSNRIVQATPVLEVYIHKDAPFDQLNGSNKDKSVLSDTAFYECYSLRKVSLPVAIEEFSNSSGPFNNCKKMTEINLHELVNLKVVGSNSFKNCDSLTEITLPNSVTTVGDRVFENCDSLRKIRISAKLTNVTQSFTYQSGVLQYIYVSNTITTSTGSHHFTTGDKINSLKGVIFFAGTYEQAMALKSLVGTNNEQRINHTNFIDYNDDAYDGWTDADFVNKAVTDEKHYVVYGYNLCDAFYESDHDYSDGKSCTDDVTCKRNCGKSVTAQFTSHNMKETLVYTSFLQSGVYNKFCANAKYCQYDRVTNQEAPTIFVMNEFNGFSESGKDGIAFGGFQLNAAALDEYNRVNSKATVKYGVVLINPDYLDGKDSFFKDGKVNSTVENKGFLQTDMSGARYANISISVTGFTGNAKNLSLILAIYAYTDANDIEFIQSETTECGSAKVTIGAQSLYTVTYASVKAGNSTLANLGEYVMPSQKEQQV